VASDTASTRSDIIKYIENQQSRLAPGQIPDSLVGISDRLPVDLENFNKKLG
jgi:hypothetical protein